MHVPIKRFKVLAPLRRGWSFLIITQRVSNGGNCLRSTIEKHVQDIAFRGTIFFIPFDRFSRWKSTAANNASDIPPRKSIKRRLRNAGCCRSRLGTRFNLVCSSARERKHSKTPARDRSRHRRNRCLPFQFWTLRLFRDLPAWLF